MIGADLTAALPELRAQAESMMTQTGTVNLPGTLEFVDNNEVRVPGAVVYSGMMRLRAAVSDNTTRTGEQQVGTQQFQGFLPWSVADLKPGYTVTVTAGNDPYLVGRTLTIESVQAHELVVHRKFIAVDLQP